MFGRRVLVFLAALSAVLVACAGEPEGLEDLRSQMAARAAVDADLEERLRAVEDELRSVAAEDEEEVARVVGELSSAQQALVLLEELIGEQVDTAGRIAEDLETSTSDLRRTTTELREDIDEVRGRLEELQTQYETLRDRLDRLQRGR